MPIGIIASTFSGELSCIIGSSRILKALADDDLFGSLLNFVKYGKTKAGNPLVAVCCSFIIAEVFVCLEFSFFMLKTYFFSYLVGTINRLA